MNTRTSSCNIIWSFLAVVSVCLWPAACALGNQPKMVASDHSEAMLVQYLGESLRHVSKAVRVDYYVPHSCGKGGLMTFPHMELRQPVNSGVGKESVRSIFRAYNNVAVKRPGTKLTVVQIGMPTNTLLATLIKSIRFSELPRYNAFLAIARIMGAKAVQQAAAKVAVFPLSVPISGFVALPAAGLPHLPKKMESITLGGALGRVAVTFKGVVLFSICKNPNGRKEVQVFFHGFPKNK